MACPARQLCDYFTSTILLTTDFCGTIPRPTVKITNLMHWHGTICILNVFLLSEREISPNYAVIFLDFVHGFGSYVKGLPKTKRCNSVAVTVSVRIRCICETSLIKYTLGSSASSYIFHNQHKTLNNLYLTHHRLTPFRSYCCPTRALNRVWKWLVSRTLPVSKVSAPMDLIKNISQIITK